MPTIPLSSEMRLNDGTTRKKVTTEGKSQVAESIEECRANNRYSLLDKNVQALNAEVPTFVQWDDHVTLNSLQATVCFNTNENRDPAIAKESPRIHLVAGTFVKFATLMLCKLVIGSVAAYDTYLTLKYSEYLHTYEQNPIGRWLLQLDNGPVCNLQQVAAFITAKVVGTLIVLIAIQMISAWRLKTGLLVALPVASFQICLAYYLTYWDFK